MALILDSSSLGDFLGVFFAVFTDSFLVDFIVLTAFTSFGAASTSSDSFFAYKSLDDCLTRLAIASLPSSSTTTVTPDIGSPTGVRCQRRKVSSTRRGRPSSHACRDTGPELKRRRPGSGTRARRGRAAAPRGRAPTRRPAGGSPGSR